jgi:hypothetical protein
MPRFSAIEKLYFCRFQMKRRRLIIPATIIIAFTISCGNHDGTTKAPVKKFPKPGTIIASAETPITNDPLNHFKFIVKVVADSNISSGVYDVDVDYGPNFAEGQFAMPKGGEDLTPLIRKDSGGFIIGFRVPNDTTFYDYFEVRASKKTTKMQYIKAYSF